MKVTWPIIRDRILHMKILSTIIMFLSLIVIFSLLSPFFLTLRNIRTIVESLPEIGLATLGVAILIICGEFDLSIGSVFALGPIIAIKLLNMGLQNWLGIFLALFLCALIGLIHGGIVLKTKIPSFIVTLAGMMVWRGVILILTEGFPPQIPATSRIIYHVLAIHIGSFRISILYFIVIAFLLWLILERTRFGNWIFAVGGNMLTARMRGVKIGKVKLICFAICSVLVGLGGLIQTFRMNAALPTSGSQYEMMAIAGAVIGGVSLTGGKGSVLGAAIGAALIILIQNGLILAGAPSYWFRLTIGLMIVFAVIFNGIIERVLLKFR